MAIVRTTRRSYGSNILNSVKGVFAGILLVIICTGLLYWNESSSVKMIRAIDDVKKNLVEITEVNPTPVSANDNKLVLVKGDLALTSLPADPAFVGITGTYKLVRTVETLLWKETKTTSSHDNLGGSTTEETTYNYTKVWTSDYINSSSFDSEGRVGHENPLEADILNPTGIEGLSLGSSVGYAGGAKIGGFTLSRTHLEQLPATNKAIPDSVSAPTGFSIKSNFFTTASNVANRPSSEATQTDIGAVRVSFMEGSATQATILGEQQADGSFTAYTSNGNTFNDARAGLLTADQFISALKKENDTKTWIFRLLLALLICIGFSLMLAPVAVIAKVIPFLGRLTRAASSFVGFLIGIAFSVAVIAISWVAVRPLIGIPLLGVTVAFIILAVVKAKKSKQVPQGQTQPQY